ncbi:hypothetical protein NMG60_11018510 [Bertholletia excelsa]
MVFQSSHPVYLDPHNWQQQQPGENPLLPPVPPPPAAGGGGSGGSTVPARPGSMAERARLAKVPQPEAGLKCPRCESTNTKFCYFNNYSLSQPRHFCKTCRRYWTRGGALRNVPVGGGCRRNKRSKRSRSKSPATVATVTADRQVGSSSGSPTVGSGVFSHLLAPPSVQLPLLASLPHLGDFGNLNFAGIRPPLVGAGSSSADMGFPIGGGLGSGSGLSARLGDQWRLQQVQQFPFLAGTDTAAVAGIFPIGAEGGGGPEYATAATAGELGLKTMDSGATQLAEVKIENNNRGLNLTRNNVLGSDQYWGGGGNAWSDLPGFTSSSASHLLFHQRKKSMEITISVSTNYTLTCRFPSSSVCLKVEFHEVLVVPRRSTQRLGVHGRLSCFNLIAFFVY